MSDYAKALTSEARAIGPATSAAAVASAFLSILLAACSSSSSPAGSTDDAAGGSTGMDATSNTGADDGGGSGNDDGATATTDASPAEGASPSPSDAAADSRPDGGSVMDVYITFYGWADNSPPGGAIAYPMSDGHPTLHETAGGAGTFADPITFATDKAELPIGTRVYVPFIEKYVIMEDDCVECDSDWTSSHKWHIDLWMNSSAGENASSLVSCEDRWTRDSTPVEIDPPAGRTVTPMPLFDPSMNTCRTMP